MKINEVIKQKRIELGYTQEQIAKYLNISTPAVSKWESGNSYPDITLLPSLARLLKTDLNTLLSFKEDLTDLEIVNFVNEIAKLKDFDGAYKRVMEKINEYPSCYSLILSTTSVLMGLYKMYGEVGREKEYQMIFEQLYKRVLASEDLKIKAQGQSALITMYLKQKEYLKAREMIELLPNVNVVDKKLRLADLYYEQGQVGDAAKIIEEKLLLQVHESLSSIVKLINIAIQEKRNDDAESLAKKYYQIASIYDCWKYNWYLGYFELYAKTKNKSKLIKTTEQLFKAMLVKWEVNESPLYRHVKGKVVDRSFYKELKASMVDELKKNPEYSFIKDEFELK